MPYSMEEIIPYKATAVTNAPYDGPYTYSWTFSDGLTATGQYVQHAYRRQFGTVSTTVSVYNEATEETTQATHEDTVSAPTLTIDIVTPVNSYLVCVNDTVSYNTNITQSWGGMILDFSWSIDGTPESGGTSLNKQWTTAGDHTVTVTATDSITEVDATSSVNTITVYNEGWNNRGDIQPYYLRSAITVDLPDGRIMYCGGFENAGVSESKRCLIFDGEHWTKVADMNYSRTSADSQCGLNGIYLGNNKVFVACGQNNYSDPERGYEIYDIEEDTWTYHSLIDPSFTFPLYATNPLYLGSGIVCVIGGWNGTGWSSAIHVINTNNNTYVSYSGFGSPEAYAIYCKPILLSTGEVAFFDSINKSIVFAQEYTNWTRHLPYYHVDQFVSISLGTALGANNACHLAEAGGYLYVYEFASSDKDAVKKCDLSVTPGSRSFTDGIDIPFTTPVQFFTKVINNRYIQMVGSVISVSYVGSTVFDTYTGSYVNTYNFFAQNGLTASSDLCIGSINDRLYIAGNEPSGDTFYPEVLITPYQYEPSKVDVLTNNGPYLHSAGWLELDLSSLPSGAGKEFLSCTLDSTHIMLMPRRDFQEGVTELKCYKYDGDTLARIADFPRGNPPSSFFKFVNITSNKVLCVIADTVLGTAESYLYDGDADEWITEECSEYILGGTSDYSGFHNEYCTILKYADGKAITSNLATYDINTGWSQPQQIWPTGIWPVCYGVSGTKFYMVAVDSPTEFTQANLLTHTIGSNNYSSTAIEVGDGIRTSLYNTSIVNRDMIFVDSEDSLVFPVSQSGKGQYSYIHIDTSTDACTVISPLLITSSSQKIGSNFRVDGTNFLYMAYIPTYIYDGGEGVPEYSGAIGSFKYDVTKLSDNTYFPDFEVLSGGVSSLNQSSGQTLLAGKMVVSYGSQWFVEV